MTTTACGDASKTAASGVVIDQGRVLTAAHVVIGAGDVSITDPAGTSWSASIVRLDATRDLAVLSVEGLAGTRVSFGQLAAGEAAAIISATSGVVTAEVTRQATLVVDEVRGVARHRRSGYELAAPLMAGDSGSGVFDGHRLAAIVFAVSNEREDTGFAVGAEEIRRFLDAEADTRYRCDTDESIVTALDSAS